MALNVAAITTAETDTSETTTATTTSSTNTDVDTETFLQLLVAQLKYQNPLDPLDSVEFLTQLAEFTNLEQLIGINDDVSAIRETLEAEATDTE